MGFTIREEQRTLCDSCDNVIKVRFRRGGAMYLCKVIDTTTGGAAVIAEPVVECTSYHEKGKLDKWEMQKVAWIIDTSPEGKFIGFKPPSKKKERDDD